MWQPRRKHAGPLACDPVILCLADLTGAETLPWGIAYPEGVRVDIKRLPRLLESMHCVPWYASYAFVIRCPHSPRQNLISSRSQYYQSALLGKYQTLAQP